MTSVRHAPVVVGEHLCWSVIENANYRLFWRAL